MRAAGSVKRIVMNDNKLINEISLLISYSIEGDITEEQFSQLEQILKSSQQGREYYYRIMSTHASLSDSKNVTLLRNKKEREADFEVLNELLAIETNSPSIELPKPVKPEAVSEITEQEIEENKKKLRFYHRIKVLVSVAAVLILAVMMLNTVLEPVEIATVTNSLNTTLSTGEEMTSGIRLIKSDSVFRLKRGLLELTYDCDARIIIESPATFSVVSGKSLKLDSGRIYLEALSKEAKGFTIITPNSDVIDLGTEFGVVVDQNGISEVHMTKGSATLKSKIHQKQPVSETLIAGHAGRVDYTGKIEKVEVKATGFVRRFDEASGVVWRGQDLSLADMIAGGNGLGDGFKQAALDPSNGKLIPWQLALGRQGDGNYKAVIENDYIDGVFVPDGGEGPVAVSSQGHSWKAPDTSGAYKFNIASSLRFLEDISGIPIGNNKSDQMLAESLHGQKPVQMVVPEAWDKLDTAQHSSIFMHSNLGITYDLERLRKVVSGHRISNFVSKFGVMEKYMHLEGVKITGMHLDLWVLVDGEIKYSAKDVDATKLFDIDIDISESDKFLSLVVTQGKDDYAFDWGLFVDPILKLEK